MNASLTPFKAGLGAAGEPPQQPEPGSISGSYRGNGKENGDYYMVYGGRGRGGRTGFIHKIMHAFLNHR